MFWDEGIWSGFMTYTIRVCKKGGEINIRRKIGREERTWSAFQNYWGNES